MPASLSFANGLFGSNNPELYSFKICCIKNYFTVTSSFCLRLSILMVKNRFEGHFCTFLLFPKQPFSVSVFMTRSIPVSKITNPRILRAVKNQCCQRRKFLRQKVVCRFNPSLTFAARIVLSFKHRFFFFSGSESKRSTIFKQKRSQGEKCGFNHAWPEYYLQPNKVGWHCAWADHYL